MFSGETVSPSQRHRAAAADTDRVRAVRGDIELVDGRGQGREQGLGVGRMRGRYDPAITHTPVAVDDPHVELGASDVDREDRRRHRCVRHGDGVAGTV